MRKIKKKKEKKKTEIENKNSKVSAKIQGNEEKNLKMVLLFSWIIPFLAVFLIYLAKARLPQKTKEIVIKILNMNFTIILVQFFVVSILQPLAFAKIPAAVIYVLMAIILGTTAYAVISHIIATMKWLKNEDYSYKFSVDIFKIWE